MTSRQYAARMASCWLICLCALLVSALPATALDVPALKNRVNDYAHLLSPATISQLDNALGHFEQQESTQIVVLTVPSLEGDSLDDFSMRVAEKWKIGRKGLDNGAILLIAKQERKLRIEVGYGLEGKLTDLVSGRIIRNIILPRFKQGNFDQGVQDGVAAMMAAVKGEFHVEAGRPGRGRTDNPLGAIGPLAIFFGFLGMILNKKTVAAGVVGAIGSPLLGMFFLGFSWATLLVLAIVGFFGGFAASAVMMSGGRGGGFFLGPGGGGFGGGFGDGGGGFGGFSGGGGGFGGGGASGGW